MAIVYPVLIYVFFNTQVNKIIRYFLLCLLVFSFISFHGIHLDLIKLFCSYYPLKYFSSTYDMPGIILAIWNTLVRQERLPLGL